MAAVAVLIGRPHLVLLARVSERECGSWRGSGWYESPSHAYADFPKPLVVRGKVIVDRSVQVLDFTPRF